MHNDTLTASGLGLTATLAVSVNSDAFAFSAPAANAEVALGAVQTVTVRWTQNGTAVVGQPVTFATTRGTLSATNAVTDANGDATVTISSSNAGGAVITATAGGSATATRALEFVATSAASIDVQPSVFTLGPMEESTLTAVVRDATDNLVKNATVTFSLQDTTGGTLTTASATTDSQGRAQTVYRAGSTTSAQDGVTVTATVQGTAVTDTVSLTVARKEVFISLGTGNSIEEVGSNTQYRVSYAVQVTDASGNGVANVPLSVSLLSQRYMKGRRVAATAPATGWGTQVTATCTDEDTNRNGVLEAAEDFNGSTRIEAGNIATVSPRNVTTDADGFAIVNVTYPQEYAFYLEVTLEARTSVQGTEFARSSTFVLSGAASDFNNSSIAPPGMVSPFGQAAVCTDPN